MGAMVMRSCVAGGKVMPVRDARPGVSQGPWVHRSSTNEATWLPNTDDQPQPLSLSLPFCKIIWKCQEGSVIISLTSICLHTFSIYYVISDFWLHIKTTYFHLMLISNLYYMVCLYFCSLSTEFCDDEAEYHNTIFLGYLSTYIQHFLYKLTCVRVARGQRSIGMGTLQESPASISICLVGV